MQRVRDGFNDRSRRRPYLEDSYSSHDIRCYCKDCDEEVERKLPLSLLEFCNCDQYTRWICMKCKVEEDEEDAQYYQTSTKGEWVWPTEGDDGVRDDGMWLRDHQEDRAVSHSVSPYMSFSADLNNKFWCPCGVRAPRDGNIRCGWCFKRHNATPRTLMRREGTSIPFFDEVRTHLFLSSAAFCIFC